MQSQYVKTARGFDYHYKAASPKGGKPTLLFLHGFPSSAELLWRNQYNHFQPLGYGILLPDLLGYGQTSHPLEVEPYTSKGIADDVVNVIEDARSKKIVDGDIICVSHDWGAGPASALVRHHQDLFIAFAWHSVAYQPANGAFDLEAVLKHLKETTGSEIFGYWRFFDKPDAPETARKNIDSFMSLLYPEKLETWATDMAPSGRATEWVEGNKITPKPKYISEEYYDEVKTFLLKNGLTGPMNWYKAAIRNLNHDTSVDESKPILVKPNWLAATQKDYVCQGDVQSALHRKHAKDPVIVKFDAGHWVQSSHPEELNRELQKWFESLV